ncbi:hypothetical protein BV20DRAFT_999883 [Pilatotrama ljubarskyi]|nr:hypothetical protein BV20DRAFT_999883 [Pilatotrama ljubarskyi]
MESPTWKGKEKATADDVLFLERLEMLYEQSLADLRAFAEREDRPLDEVRRRMAEMHSKYLFQRSDHEPSTTDRNKIIRRVLLDVSQQLESLETLAGLQSFFLVVDPNDQSDEGFLGGTVRGREFWRGHRGCGAVGAQAFKARCTRGAPAWKTYAAPAASAIDPMLLPVAAPPPPSFMAAKGPGSARELKSELYAAMRDALRTASGVRNAEMKWTNHSKLSNYGVRVVGWPDNIPLQNPSSLSVAQNKLLLEMLATGQISFVRLDGSDVPTGPHKHDADSPRPEEEAMFEDSIDYSWACTAEEDDASRTMQDSLTATNSREGSSGGGACDSSPQSHVTLASDDRRPTTPKKRRLGEV